MQLQQKKYSLVKLFVFNINMIGYFIRIKKTMKTPIIFDGRNIYSKEELDSVDIKYFQIGVR